MFDAAAALTTIFSSIELPNWICWNEAIQRSANLKLFGLNGLRNELIDVIKIANVRLQLRDGVSHILVVLSSPKRIEMVRTAAKLPCQARGAVQTIQAVAKPSLARPIILPTPKSSITCASKRGNGIRDNPSVRHCPTASENAGVKPRIYITNILPFFSHGCQLDVSVSHCQPHPHSIISPQLSLPLPLPHPPPPL